MLMALSVAILCLGALLELIDLSVAALVSCFVVFLRIELGGAYPLLFWAGASLLSLLLYPGNSAGIAFALIGLYPLAKAYLERIPRALEWVLKLLLCEALLVSYVLIARFVLKLPDAVLTGWLLPAFLLLATVVFVLYDIVLSRLITFYSFRIRPRIARYLK